MQVTRINDEIAKSASSNVIRKTTPEQGEFVSDFLAREKKDGSLWVILNLKILTVMFSIRNLRWKPLIRL